MDQKSESEEEEERKVDWVGQDMRLASNPRLFSLVSTSFGSSCLHFVNVSIDSTESPSLTIHIHRIQYTFKVYTLFRGKK